MLVHSLVTDGDLVFEVDFEIDLVGDLHAAYGVVVEKCAQGLSDSRQCSHRTLTPKIGLATERFPTCLQRVGQLHGGLIRTETDSWSLIALRDPGRYQRHWSVHSGDLSHTVRAREAERRLLFSRVECHKRQNSLLVVALTIAAGYSLVRNQSCPSSARSWHARHGESTIPLLTLAC